MILEEVIGYCEDRLYEYGENCSNDQCTHPSGHCSGTCEDCLYEVHFSTEINKRRDYCCDKLICNYVVKYAQRYKNNASIALKTIDMSLYPYLNVLSVGCGAAPDLMALEERCDNKHIFYYGYDRNTRWKDIHNFIEEQTDGTKNIEAVFERKDIFDVLDNNDISDCGFNVIFIQYLISHLFNTNQIWMIDKLYKGLIHNVISKKPKNSPFLIVINDIDSCNKGRPYFHELLDYLEDFGFSGRAVAFSNYETGDLGKIRWGVPKTRIGKIEYNYYKTPYSFEGAALIIELR